jgi:voltage-gated potassium channel
MDLKSYAGRQLQGTSSIWLLLSLVLSVLVLPLLEGLHAGRLLLLAGFACVFIFGAMSTRSEARLIAWALLVVALPVALATLFTDNKPLFVAHLLLGSAFFWFVGGAVVSRVIRSNAVSFDSIFGAISAYLLFGLAWGLSYWAIYAVAPESFIFPDHNASLDGTEPARIGEFSQFIYYSFVTMSTLGYGDITPVGRISRTLTWVQAVTGLFYVAVVIAWLVSALPRPGEKS